MKRENLYLKELLGGDVSETIDSKWLVRVVVHGPLTSENYVLYTATHDTLSAAIDDMAVQLNKEVTE